MNTLKTTAGVLFIAACLTLPFALMTDETDAQSAQFEADVAQCKARKGADAEMFLLDGRHLVCRSKSYQTARSESWAK